MENVEIKVVVEITTTKNWSEVAHIASTSKTVKGSMQFDHIGQELRRVMSEVGGEAARQLDVTREVVRLEKSNQILVEAPAVEP